MNSRTVGLVGAGGIAHQHLPGWLRLGYHVLVFSTDGQAPELTRKFGGEAVDSLEELLGCAEIVDVCTPTFTHRELVERAAAAGAHVVCEKPLALTVAECRAMIEACDRARVRLFPAHVVRYFPAYATMRAAVASDAVGEVAVQRYYRGGAAPVQPWFFRTACSGGIAMDQMIHDFDIARWVAGEVKSAYATRAAATRTGGDAADGSVGVPVTVQTVLRHRSGAVSQVTGVWGAPSLTFRTSYQVAGADGLLEHDSREHPVLSIDGLPADGKAGYLPQVDPAESPYTAQLADFANAIDSGGAARVSAQDGMEAVRIASAVNRSLAEGRPVALAEPGLEGTP